MKSQRVVVCILLSVFLAIIFGATQAKAQSTTDGAIGGTVTDPSGAVVPGASITTKNLGTDSTATGSTDGSGRYLVSHLAPGHYSLEITASGFAVISRE